MAKVQVNNGLLLFFGKGSINDISGLKPEAKYSIFLDHVRKFGFRG